MGHKGSQEPGREPCGGWDTSAGQPIPLGSAAPEGERQMDRHAMQRENRYLFSGLRRDKGKGKKGRWWKSRGQGEKSRQQLSLWDRDRK